MVEQTHDSEKEPKTTGWGPFSSIVLVIITYTVSELLGVFILNIYPVIKHWSDAQTSAWLSNSDVAQFWLTLIIETLILMFIYFLLRYKKANFKGLGLKGHPVPMDIIYILVGYGIYFFSYLAVVAVAQKFIKTLNVTQQQNVGFADTTHGPTLILVFISLVILPPIAEEIVFRGFLYTGLKNKMSKFEQAIFLRHIFKFKDSAHFSKIMAAIITSILFAVPHIFEGTGGGLLWIAGIDTFILSLVLVYLRETTGKLWASMGLHALKNFVAFLTLFVFHVS